MDVKQRLRLEMKDSLLAGEKHKLSTIRMNQVTLEMLGHE